MSAPHDWAVAVRLADGSVRYLCPIGARRGGQNEWSPRISQALRLPAKSDAEEIAARFEVNAAAREYVVIGLWADPLSLRLHA